MSESSPRRGHAAALPADGALGRTRPRALGSRSRKKAAWRAHSRRATQRTRTEAAGSTSAETAHTTSTAAKPTASAVTNASGPAIPCVKTAAEALKNQASNQKPSTEPPSETHSTAPARPMSGRQRTPSRLHAVRSSLKPTKTTPHRDHPAAVGRCPKSGTRFVHSGFPDHAEGCGR